MNIRLIGIDIDGTLLNSEGILTEATVAALQRAADRGLQVAICTGRFCSEFTDLLVRLPMVRYAVTCTGAEVLDLQTGQSLARQCLSNQQHRRLYELLRPFDSMIQIFSEFDQRIHNSAQALAHLDRFCGPKLAEMIRSSHVAEEDLDAYVAAYPGSANKIHVFYADRAEKEKAMARLQGEPIFLSESAPLDLEAMPLGVDKGVGLRALAEVLGIPRQQVMAVGDSANDVAMLRYAALGVAMGNASAEAKAAADYITASNDCDGLAQAVDALLEGRI